MRKIKYIILFLALILTIVYIISLPTAVFATTTNVTNESIMSNVTIAGTAPVVQSVTLKDVDGSELDLSADSEVVINCTGTAYDVDGVGDINLNATLYHSGSSSGAANDFTQHYTTADVNCAEINIDAINLSYNCNFSVWFHANPGTWICNVTAWDTEGNLGFNNDTQQMAQLLAIDIEVATLEFGSLAIGADTGSDDYNVTVFNDGNVDLDLTLEAWGNADGDGLIMNCDDSNMSEGFIRYDTSAATAWSSKTIVNNTGITNTGFNLAESTVTSGTPINSANATTYWGLGIPTTETNKYYNGSSPYNFIYTNDVAVDGNCNGSILFTALLSE